MSSCSRLSGQIFQCEDKKGRAAEAVGLVRVGSERCQFAGMRATSEPAGCGWSRCKLARNVTLCLEQH